ncbi:hypothetical protein HDU76_003190 [Blyttiomyces sp. JEL0837]|nr:hypothetical protein HDU76_003190 [Blyttiomyces sp. JEL0837]
MSGGIWIGAIRSRILKLHVVSREVVLQTCFLTTGVGALLGGYLEPLRNALIAGNFDLARILLELNGDRSLDSEILSRMAVLPGDCWLQGYERWTHLMNAEECLVHAVRGHRESYPSFIKVWYKHSLGKVFDAAMEALKIKFIEGLSKLLDFLDASPPPNLGMTNSMRLFTESKDFLQNSVLTNGLTKHELANVLEVVCYRMTDEERKGCMEDICLLPIEGDHTCLTSSVRFNRHVSVVGLCVALCTKARYMTDWVLELMEYSTGKGFFRV